MNKYYVIKSTDEVMKEVIYLKILRHCIFTENLAEAKLFSNYETAKKHMRYIKNNNPQTTYIDEIIEVEVDQFGNVVEIEGGNEMIKFNQPKILVWAYDCVNCGKVGIIEVFEEEETPKYCGKCGSKAEYHLVSVRANFSSEDAKHIDLTDSKAWATTKLCMDGEVMSKIAKEVLAEMKKTRLTKTTEIETEISLDQEQLQTAQMILNAFAESGYSIKEATEILEFCKDSLRYSPVGTYEFEKEEQQ